MPVFQERLAKMWLADMPQAAIEIVQNKRLAAAVAIVKLENDVCRPSFQERGLNCLYFFNMQSKLQYHAINMKVSHGHLTHHKMMGLITV